MYIEKLDIENLRCFEHAVLEFRHAAEPSTTYHDNITLLVGNNGSGKTTVLKAVALALLGPALEQSGFYPYELVRRSGSAEGLARVEASVRLHNSDTNLRGSYSAITVSAETTMLSAEINRLHDVERLSTPQRPAVSVGAGWEGMFLEEGTPAFLVLGYGATRTVATTKDPASLMSQRKRRLLRYQRVAGLFEEQTALTPLNAWLSAHKRRVEVIHLMNAMLPGETRMLDRRARDEYLFEHRGTAVPEGALSDGYRAYIGWVADLLYHLAQSCPPKIKLSDCPGVVLLDEVDLHLHPAWQLHVLPTLAQVFRQLQFIVTTHSPIVVGTVSAANIYVLHPAENGAAVASQFDEQIHGLNADQILLSSYFGLKTTRAPGFVDELDDLSIRALRGDRAAAKTFLEKLTSGSEKAPKPPAAPGARRRAPAKRRPARARKQT